MEKRIEAKGNIIETLEGERFRILELVSESRMSVVYRAERLIEDGNHHVLEDVAHLVVSALLLHCLASSLCHVGRD